MKWQTFGHLPAKNILEKQLGSGKVPHAYLFAGQEGIGKKTLALEFSRMVLQAERLDNHPDFFLLDCDGEITMEEMLNFTARLSFKPFLAGKKVAIINNAQNLNPQSGNALLKTLEEPAGHTTIILISSGKLFLPTIVSRCCVINMGAFSFSQLREAAEALGLKVNERQIKLSFGRIDRLKALAENKIFLQKEESIIEDWEKMQATASTQRLAKIPNYAENDTGVLDRIFTTWMHWQMAVLSSAPQSWKKVAALTQAIEGLKINKNKKLILQGLMLKI